MRKTRLVAVGLAALVVRAALVASATLVVLLLLILEPLGVVGMPLVLGAVGAVAVGVDVLVRNTIAIGVDVDIGLAVAIGVDVHIGLRSRISLRIHRVGDAVLVLVDNVQVGLAVAVGVHIQVGLAVAIGVDVHVGLRSLGILRIHRIGLAVQVDVDDVRIRNAVAVIIDVHIRLAVTVGIHVGRGRLRGVGVLRIDRIGLAVAVGVNDVHVRLAVTVGILVHVRLAVIISVDIDVGRAVIVRIHVHVRLVVAVGVHIHVGLTIAVSINIRGVASEHDSHMVLIIHVIERDAILILQVWTRFAVDIDVFNRLSFRRSPCNRAASAVSHGALTRDRTGTTLHRSSNLVGYLRRYVARSRRVVARNRGTLQHNGIAMVRIHVRQLDLVIIRRRYLVARRINNLLNLVAILGRDRDGSVTAILYDGITTNRALSAGNGGGHAMEHRRKRVHDRFAIRGLFRSAVVVRSLLGEVHLNLVIFHNACLIHCARIEHACLHCLHRLSRQRHEQRAQQHAEQINLRRRVVLNSGRCHTHRWLFVRTCGNRLRSCLLL